MGNIAIIGAGAMGGALARGIISRGGAESLIVSDPSEAVLGDFAAMGARTFSNNVLAAAEAEEVIVVVKPWLVGKVLEELGPVLDASRQTLVIVAAGVSPEDLIADAPDMDIVLAIPNLAAAQCQSMTFLSPVLNLHGGLTRVRALFDTLGRTAVVPYEQLAAGTTLASCGLAYAMRYIRAAMEAGVELGFPAATAQSIVQQTVKGAVGLLEAEGCHPEEAIDRVTTPGGVTIRGLNEMEAAGFSTAVIRGIKAGMK